MLKKLFTSFLAIAFSSSVFATTLNPIQLLNPAGSTAGQVIASTGPTSAPAWTNVTLSGLGGLSAANNLSDVVSASASRTNLGLGTAAVVNTGSSGATIPLLNTANTWTLAQSFTVRPTFNGATPWDGSNLVFATPPAIGGTTPAAGAFTTLAASGLITPASAIGIKGTAVADNAQAGSIGETRTSTVTALGITTATVTNVTSISLTAGDWYVYGSAGFTSGAGTTIVNALAGSSVTSATIDSFGTYWQTQGTQPVNATLIEALPWREVNVSTTTTVYLIVTCSFSGGTATASGKISAVRFR